MRLYLLQCKAYKTYGGVYMSLLLNVPYSEKDEAKALGARWNPDLKKWYATDKKDYHKFARWFTNQNADLIICNRLYIIVSEQHCFKCKKPTSVVSLASDSYLIIEDDHFELIEEDINFIQDVDYLPESLKKYLNDNYKFYNGYSKTTHSNYFGNHCDSCGVLQGNFFLYSEPDSPFFMDSVEKAENLKVLKIKLPFDLAISGTVGWCSGDHMIKEYAKVTDLDLKL